MSSQNFSNDNQVWDTFFQSFLENFLEVLTMSYGIESLGMIYLKLESTNFTTAYHGI